MKILSVPMHCSGSDLAPDPWEYRKPRTKACYLHASVLTFGVQHAPPRHPTSGARNPGEKVPPPSAPGPFFPGLRNNANYRPLLRRMGDLAATAAAASSPIVRAVVAGAVDKGGGGVGAPVSPGGVGP